MEKKYCSNLKKNQGFDIVVALLSPTKADNFVLYKSDIIFSKKDYTLEDNCKIIFVEPEKNSYNGCYTVAKYPLSQFEKVGDTLVLYDFRDKSNFTKLLYTCKSTPLPEMKGLVVLGYFNISEKDIKWFQEAPPKTPPKQDYPYKINSLLCNNSDNDYKINNLFSLFNPMSNN